MSDIHNNGSIHLITIQYIINGNYRKKNGKLNNHVYIQAILKKNGVDPIPLPINPSDCIGEYNPHVDYERNLQGGAYKAITERLSTKIFNRIAKKI